ncbi:MAG: putative manganese transporter [Candidatus Cryptobacteroides sp.]
MHLFIDILRNSILITGLVTVMMMMIESLNIESNGLVFKGLRKTKTGQVVIAALLGSIPGCMGGFATVSLYTHGLFSFGALIAMMIASSGDEAFVMLAMVPDKALTIFMILFVVAVAAGILTDLVKDRLHRRKCHKEDHSECHDVPDCQEGYAVHEPDREHNHGAKGQGRHFGWKRCVMFVGLAVFIAALATGRLSHEHGAEGHGGHEGHDHTECTCAHGGEAHGEFHDGEVGEIHGHEDGHATFRIDLLSEDWMNVLFAGLSVIVLIVLVVASDHFIEEHLWNHIVKKHLPTIFAWTFGVLLVIGIGLQYIDIENWISDNTILMILLATAVGIIPESGPHLIFVTLYAAGLVPMPVLLASCISQDGHASIPLLAESKKSFIVAKLINCGIAIIVGFAAYLFI